MPKHGAQFHFELPGSVQGFLVTRGEGSIENVKSKSALGDHTLKLTSSRGESAFGSPVFAPSKDIAKMFGVVVTRCCPHQRSIQVKL